jgi:hypothetical protein
MKDSLVVSSAWEMTKMLSFEPEIIRWHVHNIDALWATKRHQQCDPRPHVSVFVRLWKHSSFSAQNTCIFRSRKCLARQAVTIMGIGFSPWGSAVCRALWMLIRMHRTWGMKYSSFRPN